MVIEQPLTKPAVNKAELIREANDYNSMYRDLAKIFYDPTGQGKEGNDDLMKNLNEMWGKINKSDDEKIIIEAQKDLRDLYLEWCVNKQEARMRIEKELEKISEQMRIDYHAKWLKQGVWPQREHIVDAYKKLCEEEGVAYDNDFIKNYCKEQHGF